MNGMKWFLIITMCMYISGLFAQDPFFTQTHSAATYLNPAMTGSSGSMNLASLYHSNRSGYNGYYRTSFDGYDHYLKKLHGGIGAYYMRDNSSGILFTNRIALTYAARFSLFSGKIFIQPGVEFAYYSKRIDWNQLNFGDMIDSRKGFIWNTQETPNYVVLRNPDIGAGLLTYSKRFYVGFAAHHLNRPPEGFIGVSRLPIHTTVHAGYILAASDTAKFQVIPGLVYMYQGGIDMLTGSVKIQLWKERWWSISPLLAYRKNNGFSVGLSGRIWLFDIGYSYDHNSFSANFPSSSHEFSAIMRIPNRRAGGTFLRQTSL